MLTREMGADTLFKPAQSGVPAYPPGKEKISPDLFRCSVIIPVYYGGSHFAQCLSCASAALRPNDELIVVTGGEGDGAWRAAELSRARIVHAGRNVGPAAARNLGASTAAGDFFLFVDADVAVPADCIRKCAELFAAEHDLGAIIGSYDASPGEGNFVSQYKNLFHHYVHQHGRAEASTFWGACGAIRREAFFDVAGFDENYPLPTVEDIEFGYRLRAKSYRIRLLHSLQVTHWKRWQPANLLRSDTLDRAAPWAELILEQRRSGRAVPDDLNLGADYKVSLLASLTFLAALVGAIVFHPLLIVAAAAAIVFLSVNLSLLNFFRQKRGLFFCLRAVLWRFLYDLCGATGALVGLGRFLARRSSTAVAVGARMSESLEEIPAGVRHLPETK